uniref:Uncharacterized protein n=1 Tax=Vitrella brassicaformis TaxID=1169539 RepID=A0A6U4CEP3_9ALVE
MHSLHTNKHVKNPTDARVDGQPASRLASQPSNQPAVAADKTVRLNIVSAKDNELFLPLPPSPARLLSFSGSSQQRGCPVPAMHVCNNILFVSVSVCVCTAETCM